MKFSKTQHLQVISIIVVLFLSVLGISSFDKKTVDEVEEMLTPENEEVSLPGQKTQAVVVKVIDGDTIELDTGEKLRYIGIDTPETKHPTVEVECFGQEASARNEELVLGKTVTLEKDVSETDRYGRLLRYVYVDDQMINELLVREGIASAASFPPDIKYQQRLQEAEQMARDEEKGLWGNCPLNND